MTRATGVSRGRSAGIIFALLASLFLARVLGQLLQSVAPVGWLPPFALWHSASLPYPALLLAQVIILALMGLAIRRSPAALPRPALGRLLCAAAGLYALVMALRFLLGAADVTDIAWLDAPVATPFHLVLAGFLFLSGAVLLDPEQRASLRRSLAPYVRALSYPAVMTMAVALFFWLRRLDAPPAFSAYLPVVLAGAAILIHEQALPYRDSWSPDRADIIADGVFMGVVQVLLPALLTLVLIDLLAADRGGAVVQAAAIVWPHDWPVAAQALIMLMTAEFFRYWLHRAAHAWMPLWRLHAVHHSPKGLYFLNVGRFHPLEKMLQFLVDAAPFLLLGVSGEVVSAYFVFYAANGFYQHSNADLRLGWLNWLVSGPELHRWHHSVLSKESDRNFGNNSIIWDVVFGTRWLPRGRSVGDLGLRNEAYPVGFVGQTLAPITANPNAD